MPKKTAKIGLIGAGGWGRHHAGGYTSAPNAELVAVADTDKRKAEALAADFNVPRAYGSVEELLADDEVYGVSIVIPNRFHADVALQALAAGKHVMLDKPFALNAPEARRVVAAARKSGLTFMVGMNQRFDANVQSVKPVVEKGRVGEVYHAKAYWLRRSGIPMRSPWFGTKALSGGGPMIDIGVHLLDLCLYLMDNFEPVSVTAGVYDGRGKTLVDSFDKANGIKDRVFDVEDFATAMIRMADGATVQLEASWVLHMDQPNKMNVELYGTEGTVSLHPPKLYQPAKRNGGYVHTEIGRPTRLRYPHCSRYQHYADVLLGTPQLVSWDQSLAVQCVLDAVYESAAKGREVRIKSAGRRPSGKATSRLQ